MEHLWAISKKIEQHYKFYTFPISFKMEIVFERPNDCLILIFCGERNYFLDFLRAFCRFILGFLYICFRFF
jgi:hypothetical protein